MLNSLTMVRIKCLIKCAIIFFSDRYPQGQHAKHVVKMTGLALACCWLQSKVSYVWITELEVTKMERVVTKSSAPQSSVH